MIIRTSNILATLLIIIAIHKLPAQHAEGSLVDERDGRTYRTVQFSIPTAVEGVVLTREWMAENLMYESDQSYCYKNHDSYCDAYGRLYNFNSAVGACPTGWRLPTHKDWMELVDVHGGLQAAGNRMGEGGGSPLELLYSGFGKSGGYYHGVEQEGYYWGLQASASAGVFVLQRGNGQVFHDNADVKYLTPIRCIKE